MANTYNLLIEQGADFALAVQYKDPTGNAVNLAGYTARSQIRTAYAAPKALINLTVALGESDGYINLSANAIQTAALPATNTAVWDLELVSPSNTVIRLLEGTVRISPEVTRP